MSFFIQIFMVTSTTVYCMSSSLHISRDQNGSAIHDPLLVLHPFRVTRPQTLPDMSIRTVTQENPAVDLNQREYSYEDLMRGREREREREDDYIASCKGLYSKRRPIRHFKVEGI